MLGYCKKDGYLCLITECVKGGSLATALFNGSQIDPIAIAIEIAKGMVYLHNRSIIHRDLKPGMRCTAQC
jgi:serine/threonine protein kinase